MATPSCPKCGNTTFEMKDFEIRNANYRHSAICCSVCGAIVATEEAMSAMYMLRKIGEKLGVQFGP